MSLLDGVEAQAMLHFSHLERSDSVIVNCGHLILCQSVPRLVVNLKTSIELEHVQKLKGYIYINKPCRYKNEKPWTKTTFCKDQASLYTFFGVLENSGM